MTPQPKINDNSDWEQKPFHVIGDDAMGVSSVTERQHVSVMTGWWRVVGDVSLPMSNKKCDVLVFGQ